MRPRPGSRERSPSGDRSNQDHHHNDRMQNYNRLYDARGTFQHRPTYATNPRYGLGTNYQNRNINHDGYYSERGDDEMGPVNRHDSSGFDRRSPDRSDWPNRYEQKRHHEFGDHHNIPYKYRRESNEGSFENEHLNRRNWYNRDFFDREPDIGTEPPPISLLSSDYQDLQARQSPDAAASEPANRRNNQYEENYRNQSSSSESTFYIDKKTIDLREKLNRCRKTEVKSKLSPTETIAGDLRNKLERVRNRSETSKSNATKRAADAAVIKSSQTTRNIASDNQEKLQEEVPTKKRSSKSSDSQVTSVNKVNDKNIIVRRERSAETSTSGSSSKNETSTFGSVRPSTSGILHQTALSPVRPSTSGMSKIQISNRIQLNDVRVVLEQLDMTKVLNSKQSKVEERPLAIPQNENVEIQNEDDSSKFPRDPFKQIKFLYYLRNSTYRNVNFSLFTEVESSKNLSDQLFLFEDDTKSVLCEAKFINIAGLQANIKKDRLTYRNMSNSEFDLTKYFKIFLDWKIDSTRKPLQKIVIYCNFEWNKTILQKNKVDIKKDEENLTKFEYPKDFDECADGDEHEWYKKFLDCCPMRNLAKEIIRTMENKKVNFNSKLMKKYIGALVKERVIEIKEGEKKYVTRAIFHKDFHVGKNLSNPALRLRGYVIKILGGKSKMQTMTFSIPNGSDVSSVISNLFDEDPELLFKEFIKIFRYGRIEDDFNEYDKFLPQQLAHAESAEHVIEIQEHTLTSIGLEKSLEETTQSLEALISKCKVIKKSLKEVTNLNIIFENETIVAMKNKVGNGDRRIIHLCLTESVSLTTLLIKQVSKTIFLYRENEEALFITDDTLLEMTDNVIDTLSLETTKLLAIQWNRVSYDEFEKSVYAKIQNVLNNIPDDIKKSVVIIAKTDCSISELGSVKIFDGENSFKLTQESQKEVLQLKNVTFQERSFGLLDLMDEQTATDFIKIPKVLESLAYEKLKFGNEFSEPYWLTKNYFDFQLKQQVIIDKKIFKEDIDEVFCIKNIESRKLRDIIPSNQEIYDSKKFPMKAKFILMDPHIDNYSLIFNYFQQKPIHIFNYVDYKFVWQTTRGSIKSLLKYKIDDYDALSTSTQIDDVLKSGPKTIIISGDSGIGKSTYLYNLAQNLYSKCRSEVDTHYWIVYTNFEKLNIKVPPKTTDEAIELLASHLGLKNQQKKLFFMSANSELKIKTVLFVDGCDDLPFEDLKVPINLLQKLQETSIHKIVVTSRLDFTLESELDVFSYQLQFSRELKIQFLKNYWNIAGGATEKANAFIQKYTITESTENDFTSTPLHLKMLAEINKGKNELVSVNNYHDLYKFYIKSTANEEQISDVEKLLVQKIMRDKVTIELKKNESELPKDLSHISFAEYFVARSLSTCTNTPSYNILIPLIDNTFINSVSRVFLGTLLPLLKTNRKIQTFMNKLAQDGYLRFLKIILEFEIDAKPCLHDLINNSHREKLRNFKNTTLGTLAFILKHYNSTGDDEIMKHGEVKSEYLDSNIVNYVNSEKENVTPIQLAAAQNRADLACELLLYGADILKLENSDFIPKMTNYVVMKIIAGDRRFYCIAEKLLTIIPPEQAINLCKQNYFKILAYFFTHGRIKIIKRLLPGPDERTDFLKQCPEDESPVDLINKSQDLNDEERCKMIQYISNNFGDDSIKKNIDQVLRAACRSKHWHAFSYSVGTYQIEFLKSILLDNDHQILEFLKGRGRTYLTDKEGNTAVHMSITMGLSPWTISKAAEICGVDDCNNDGRTALHTAFWKGVNLSQIKYLIDKKSASLDQKDKYGLYPWCYLFVDKFSRYNKQQILEMMDYLLTNGTIEAPKCTETNIVNDTFIREVQQKFKYYLNLKNLDSDDIDIDIPPLHSALKDSSKENWCSFLINQLPNINDRDPNGNASLHIALHNERYNLVKLILRRGAIIDSVDENGLTPLQILSTTLQKKETAESYDKVKNLLQLAEKIFTEKDGLRDNLSKSLTQFDKLPIRYLVSCCNKKHQNLYHIAASFGSASTIVNLVKFNKHCIEEYKTFEPLNMNQQDDDGNTPMHIASEKKHHKVVEELFRFGARYDITNGNGKMPVDLANDKSVFQASDELFAAVKERDIEKVREIFESKKYLVNARDKEGKCSLHYATDAAMMKLLVQNMCTLYKHQEFADIDVVDSNSQSPLYCAAKKDYLDCAKLLLRAGDSFELKNFKGENNPSVQLLRDIEVLFEDVKSDDPKYFTNENAWQLTDYLKVRCHDVIVNARDDTKNTLLHYAAKYNFTKAIEVLLKNGAIYNVKNRKNQTPKDLAKNTKNLFESLDKLFKNLDLAAWKELDLDLQIIVNCRTKGGYTLLHKVVKSGKQEEKEWLIEQGANVENTDDFGVAVRCNS